METIGNHLGVHIAVAVVSVVTLVRQNVSVEHIGSHTEILTFWFHGNVVQSVVLNSGSDSVGTGIVLGVSRHRVTEETRRNGVRHVGIVSHLNGDELGLHRI